MELHAATARAELILARESPSRNGGADSTPCAIAAKKKRSLHCEIYADFARRMPPTFFRTSAEFRQWLERHHAAAKELWVGYYKKASGRGGMVYREAVDEALCFGWIDGLTKSLDANRYMQRFTPRKPRSNWSNVNVAHVARLKAAGKMHPAGLAAFAARDKKKTGVYAFENRPQQFPAALQKTFRANPKAWTFWSAQPPGYHRTLIWWVISAKQTATRQRRLATLIAESAAGRRVK